MGRGYHGSKTGDSLPCARRTGCGAGQSVMGPFYCPADGTVYIDLSFYDDMKKISWARTVILPGLCHRAHEVGHHVQNC